MSKADPLAGVASLLSEAHAALDRYDYRSAFKACQEALALLSPDSAPQLTAMAHYISGEALYERGQTSSAEEHAKQAETLFDSVGDHRHLLLSRLRVAACLQWRGDLQTALHIVSQVLSEAREHELPELEAHAMLALANIAWKRGDRQMAMGDLQKAQTLFNELGIKGNAMRAQATFGFVLSLQGQLKRGRELMEECRQYFMERGDTNSLAKTLSNLGFSYFSQGDLGNAREMLLQASELDEDSHDQTLVLSTWYNLGLIDLLSGRRSSAKECFVRAFELATKASDQVLIAMSLVYQGVLALYACDPTSAAQLVLTAKTSLAGSECSEAELIQYYEALILLVSEQVEQARALWLKKPNPDDLRDCLDDFQIISQVLGFLMSSATQAKCALSPQILYVADCWREEMCQALLRLGRPCDQAHPS